MPVLAKSVRTLVAAGAAVCLVAGAAVAAPPRAGLSPQDQAMMRAYPLSMDKIVR